MLVLLAASGALLPPSVALRPARQLARHRMAVERSDGGVLAELRASYWEQKRGFLQASGKSIDFELSELQARENVLTAMLTEAHTEIARLKATSQSQSPSVALPVAEGGTTEAQLAAAKAALAESEARVAAMAKQVVDAAALAKQVADAAAAAPALSEALSDEQAEIEHLAALEAAAELRERDVQKVAAFWIDKLASAKAAKAAAVESAQYARKANVQVGSTDGGGAV